MMDASGRLAGRGAYLCDDPACRRIALDKNILTRALHVPLPDDLRSALEPGTAPERRPGVDPGTAPEPRPGVDRGTGRANQSQIAEQMTTPGGTIGQE